MLDRLQKMKALVAASDASSFAAAARLIGVSAASLSRYISSAEAEFGVTLFRRSTRGHVLTEEGRHYVEVAKKIIALYDDLQGYLTNSSSAPHGLLTVHARPVVADALMTEMLPGFLAAYPGISLKIWLSDDHMDLLDNRIDVALRFGNLREDYLIAKKIADMHGRIICASPDYLQTAPPLGKPDDLVNHSCLTWQIDDKLGASASRWHFRSAAGGTAVDVESRLQVNSAHILRASVLKDMGVALLPSWIVADDVRSGRLVALLPDYEVTPTSFDTAIHAVYLSANYQTPKIRAFVDYLANQHRLRGRS